MSTQQIAILNVLGVLYMDNSIMTALFDREDLNVLESLCSQAGISIENAILYKNQKDQERLKKEMEIAEKIQTAIVPEAPQHDELEIAAIMKPAEEVGGDYYDIIFDKQNNLWFAIGDVTGHGVTPGLIMMMAQAFFSANINHENISPKNAIIEVNGLLYENVRNRLKESHFMTMSFVKYIGKGKFEYSNAGHPGIIIYRKKTNTCEEVYLNSPYLSILKDISKIIEQQSFSLNKDDIMVLYTDGIVEAHHKDDRKKLFGIDKLYNIIIKYCDKDVEIIKENILKETLDWCGNKPDDDITMIVIRKK